jgi:hypothetical protein
MGSAESGLSGRGRLRLIQQGYQATAPAVRPLRQLRRSAVPWSSALILCLLLAWLLQLFMSTYIVQVYRLPARGDGTTLTSSTRRSVLSSSTVQPLPSIKKRPSPRKPLTSPRRPRNITLIVETKGELGNHLNSLAHGLRIKHWIESEFPHLTVLLQAEHRDDHKWHSVADTLSQCFPFLRDNVEIWQGGAWMREPINTQTLRSYRVRRKHKLLEQNRSIAEYIYNASRYDRMAELQEEWLRTHGLDQNTTLHMDRCPLSAQEQTHEFATCWESTLEVVLQMHREQEVARVTTQNGSSSRNISDPTFLIPEPLYPSSEPPLKYVSLPFLRTTAWSFGVPFTGEYYELIRKWFTMNQSDPNCCLPQHELPGPDEIVWHFRNFRGERPELHEQGFVEVSPVQAVRYLFEPAAVQQPSDYELTPIKVAMLSRFPSELRPYAEALSQSPTPFQVRIIENGTVASDFCFLLNARFSLYVVHLSSFAGWASILGHAPVHLYVVNDTFTNNRAVRLRKSFMQSVGRMGWIRENPRFSLSIIPAEVNETKWWGWNWLGWRR